MWPNFTNLLILLILFLLNYSWMRIQTSTCGSFFELPSLYKVQIYFSVISLVSCPIVTTMRKFEGTSSGKNYSKIPTIVSTRYQKLSKSFIKLRNFRLWSLVLFCIYNQQLSVITFFKSVKFTFSEKATKFYKISTNHLTGST